MAALRLYLEIVFFIENTLLICDVSILYVNVGFLQILLAFIHRTAFFLFYRSLKGTLPSPNVLFVFKKFYPNMLLSNHLSPAIATGVISSHAPRRTRKARNVNLPFSSLILALNQTAHDETRHVTHG